MLRSQPRVRFLTIANLIELQVPEIRSLVLVPALEISAGGGGEGAGG